MQGWEFRYSPVLKQKESSAFFILSLQMVGEKQGLSCITQKCPD